MRTTAAYMRTWISGRANAGPEDARVGRVGCAIHTSITPNSVVILEWTHGLDSQNGIVLVETASGGSRNRLRINRGLGNDSAAHPHANFCQPQTHKPTNRACELLTTSRLQLPSGHDGQ